MNTVVIIASWLLLTLGGFWSFGKYFVPVTAPEGSQAPANVIGSQIRQDSGNQVTVLNFWNPDCPCSKFMEGHVKGLIAKYEGRVAFTHMVESPEPSANWIDRVHGFDARAKIEADPKGDLARKYGVWAAPAAVVIDANGKVVYVGAYNITRFCDDEKSAFAEQAIEALLEGRKPKVQTTPFYGCQVIGKS